MIPDIALMIVVYGSARLLIAAMDPARRSSGTIAQIANWLTWTLAAGAVVALVLLGVDVVGSATSLPGVTG